MLSFPYGLGHIVYNSLILLNSYASLSPHLIKLSLES